MAGSRKFSVEHMSRNDLAALTPEAAAVSGIPPILETDRMEVDQVFNSR